MFTPKIILLGFYLKKNNDWPGSSGTMRLLLRRTLMRSEQQSTVDRQLSTENSTAQECDREMNWVPKYFGMPP